MRTGRGMPSRGGRGGARGGANRGRGRGRPTTGGAGLGYDDGSKDNRDNRERDFEPPMKVPHFDQDDDDDEYPYTES